MEAKNENDVTRESGPVLAVKDLKTYYYTTIGLVKAVDAVDLTVQPNEFVGVAGESGCGKTTFGQSIMRVINYPGRIAGGEIRFHNEDLVKISENQMEKIRGRKISMVLQAAMNALNPVFRIDKLFSEPMVHHLSIDKSEALEKAKKAVELVGLSPKVLKAYPHELSGGMKQRIVIAMAISMNPDLVILDEPITALDVIIQRQILDLLQDLQKTYAASFVLITHDLPIMLEVCDKTAIMYAGKIVEQANEELGEYQLHPYTAALCQSMPDIRSKKERLSPIEGFPPNLINPPSGCRFHPRCKHARDICSKEEPQLIQVKPEHYVACHLVEEFM